MAESTTATATRPTLLIAADDPIPQGARFIEARFRDPEGEWHPLIPGAKLATLYNGVLAAHPQPDTGRFPLPDPGVLAGVFSDWDIEADTPVVVYATTPDDAKTAARAWFVLRHAGIEDVRVIDGGIDGWKARDEASITGEPVRGPQAPVVAIDADRAQKVGAQGRLLDARPAFAYVDGHIPGAKCVPGTTVFEDGYLLPEEALAAWAAKVTGEGDLPLAAYCGGGVAAAGVVFALATLGIPVPLYVGSWSQWSRLPGRPAARA